MCTYTHSLRGSLPTLLTIASLAAAPRTGLEGLTGRCRGDLLGPWGENVTKRFGAEGLARVRRRLGFELAPVLTAKDWVPIHAQLAVTEAIVDELLHGDWLALGPLLIEDTRAGVGRIQLGLLRAMGPGNAFKLTSKTFAQVYDRGSGAAVVSGKSARLEFSGNAVFAHPRWQLMQLYAMNTMLALCKTMGELSGEDAGPEGFVAHVRW